jgi:hypothetical protein
MNRRTFTSLAVRAPIAAIVCENAGALPAAAQAAADPLPSWNDGTAKMGF